MARLRYGLLGLVASAIIAATSLTSAFAEEAVTAPARVQDEQVAPGPAAAPAVSSNARAEVTRPIVPSRPKTVQANNPPHPFVIADHRRCWWFCGHQMVLMLGVAY
jgi:hypothetical protein